MLDGFYAVLFGSPAGEGGGVILLEGGKIRGGDSTVYYHGTYRTEENELSADLQIDTHLNLPGHTTVFGIPKASLSVSGTASNGQIRGKATSPQAPGIEMTFTMRKLPV